MCALTVADCLRRCRSRSQKPPAERRLKNATPASHASTSQGNTSHDDPVERILGASEPTAPAARLPARATARGHLPLPALLSLLDSIELKTARVATGAASIRTRTPSA